MGNCGAISCVTELDRSGKQFTGLSKSCLCLRNLPFNKLKNDVLVVKIEFDPGVICSHTEISTVFG